MRLGRGGVGQGRQSVLPLAHPSNLNHLVIVTSPLAASKCNLRVGEGAAGSNRVARGCDSLVTRQQLSTTHVSTPQAGWRQHRHYWCHMEDDEGELLSTLGCGAAQHRRRVPQLQHNHPAQLATAKTEQIQQGGSKAAESRGGHKYSSKAVSQL
ncbi:hypothetical protein Pcinc_030142 [Petrolisthes cinctipes]|uniref:Uncharacterized protein n=1 Tax=Petrolisthes cinctipes TaxID=88211 RepID=A0AAE1EZG9_PETCI|nr:hypothetical protein Pcinc_030142 [Petrolisthes cinctipes]